MMKKPQTKVSRRSFLFAATAGTAATAVAIAVKSTDNKSGTKRGSSELSKQGYQVTEHVRNYYRTAKI